MIRVCALPDCENEFNATENYEFNRRLPEYCSNKCKKAAQRLRSIEYAKKKKQNRTDRKKFYL